MLETNDFFAKVHLRRHVTCCQSSEFCQETLAVLYYIVQGMMNPRSESRSSHQLWQNRWAPPGHHQHPEAVTRPTDRGQQKDPDTGGMYYLISCPEYVSVGQTRNALISGLESAEVMQQEYDAGTMKPILAS